MLSRMNTLDINRKVAHSLIDAAFALTGYGSVGTTRASGGARGPRRRAATTVATAAPAPRRRRRQRRSNVAQQQMT